LIRRVEIGTQICEGDKVKIFVRGLDALEDLPASILSKVEVKNQSNGNSVELVEEPFEILQRKPATASQKISVTLHFMGHYAGNTDERIT
jgi:hypothetical protein